MIEGRRLENFGGVTYSVLFPSYQKSRRDEDHHRHHQPTTFWHRYHSFSRSNSHLSLLSCTAKAALLVIRYVDSSLFVSVNRRLAIYGLFFFPHLPVPLPVKKGTSLSFFFFFFFFFFCLKRMVRAGSIDSLARYCVVAAVSCNLRSNNPPSSFGAPPTLPVDRRKHSIAINQTLTSIADILYLTSGIQHRWLR